MTASTECKAGKGEERDRAEKKKERDKYRKPSKLKERKIIKVIIRSESHLKRVRWHHRFGEEVGEGSRQKPIQATVYLSTIYIYAWPLYYHCDGPPSLPYTHVCPPLSADKRGDVQVCSFFVFFFFLHAHRPSQSGVAAAEGVGARSPFLTAPAHRGQP